MAIRHTIRKNGKGDMAELKLTPIKAIRCQCLECMGFVPSEVKLCRSGLCPLFPFRMGKAHAGRKGTTLPRIEKPRVEGQKSLSFQR